MSTVVTHGLNGKFYITRGFQFGSASTVVGGKGDNPIAYKPTGLGPRRKKRVDATETHRDVIDQAAREFFSQPLKQEAAPVQTMSLAEIDFEIGYLMHKQFRTQEDELMLLLLMAASQ